MPANPHPLDAAARDELARDAATPGGEPPTLCAVCGTACTAPLVSQPDGSHLWFVPRDHGFPNISGGDESCAKCGKMRGPVNESRPCPGVTKRTSSKDWFR